MVTKESLRKLASGKLCLILEESCRGSRKEGKNNLTRVKNRLCRRIKNKRNRVISVEN